MMDNILPTAPGSSLHILMKQEGTLYHYWMALYRRKSAILLVSLSAAAFAYGVSLALPPVYEAQSTFYVPFASSTALYTADVAVGQVEKAPLMPVVEEKQAGVHLGILQGNEIASAILEKFPDKTQKYLNLNVDFVLSEHFLIDVFVRDRDPQLAAAVANAYPPAYKAFHARSLSARSAMTSRALEEQLAATKNMLAANLQAQQRLRDRNTSPSVAMESLQSEHQRLAALITTLEQNLIEARLQAQHPAVELIVVQRATAPEKPAFPRPILNAVVALILGLVGGCYYALLLEYLSKLRRYRVAQNMDLSPLEAREGHTV